MSCDVGQPAQCDVQIGALDIESFDGPHGSGHEVGEFVASGEVVKYVAWASLAASASPLEVNCSLANARIVSSMR